MKSNCYDNRELSWLKFNQRVLEEAKDETNPLCERLSFLSIFQSNLDEFFMVRCGSLYDQMCEDPHFRENKTNMTCKEQLTAIYARVRELLRDKDDAYADLRAELSMQGVDIVDFHTITTEEAAWLEAYFKAEIEPLLSPQIIGKKQPFPFLQNKNIYAVVVLEKKARKAGHCAVQQRRFPEDRLPAHRKEPVHPGRGADPALCTGDLLPAHHQEQVANPNHPQCGHRTRRAHGGRMRLS